MKQYLNTLPIDTVKQLVKHPGELYRKLYNIAYDNNMRCQSTFVTDTLADYKGEYRNDVRADYSYDTLYLTIVPGHYEFMLDIGMDYFGDDDAKYIKEEQNAIRELVDKIGQLEDTEDYYDRLNEYEDEADEHANNILKIVADYANEYNNVTDDQILEEALFIGDMLYIEDNDLRYVYKDITECYECRA